MCFRCCSLSISRLALRPTRRARRSNPHNWHTSRATAHTSRDFVPWRFSDAGRRSVWLDLVAGCRKPAQEGTSPVHRIDLGSAEPHCRDEEGTPSQAKTGPRNQARSIGARGRCLACQSAGKTQDSRRFGLHFGESRPCLFYLLELLSSPSQCPLRLFRAQLLYPRSQSCCVAQEA